MTPRSEQGVSRERYMLIPRVLIFLRRGESVLLIKGAPTKRLWANKYNGIGGHVEQGEDILSAARRELREETGLSAELWLAGTVMVDSGDNPGISLFIFTGDYQRGKLKSTSEGTLEWISLAQVQNLPAVEDLTILLARLQAMRRGEPPFSARSYYDQDEGLILVFEEGEARSSRIDLNSGK